VTAELFSPEFEADPHPVYAKLRADRAVQRVVLPGGLPAWLVAGYDEARQALADHRLVKNGLVAPTGANPAIPKDVWTALNEHMLAADPPDHTRLRRLVSKVFTARCIERLRPRVREIADELLTAMTGRAEVDLIAAYAFPLPIRVICELLGVPMADRARFRELSDTMAAGVVAGDRLPGAYAGMLDYMRELVARKRAEPGDDLVSALIDVRDEGDGLTENELVSTVFLLLFAGHETTTNLIGNGVLTLLADRDRWELLRTEPSLLPTAVEELLRFESPVETATYRVAAEPLEIGGVRIPEGEPVLIGLQAGNRDHARFASPDRVELARSHNPHLAFGHGIHYCLGAPLARLEGQVALGLLLARYPELRLAGGAEILQWRPGVLLRGLVRLPVVLR
jgi:cytochrome P450